MFGIAQFVQKSKKIPLRGGGSPLPLCDDQFFEKVWLLKGKNNFEQSCYLWCQKLKKLGCELSHFFQLWSVEFSVVRWDVVDDCDGGLGDGCDGGLGDCVGWCWGTIHFVIHNKSRAQPDSPQPVPKILMTLSGADCLGWHATPVTLSYWDSIGQTSPVLCPHSQAAGKSSQTQPALLC